MKLFGRTIFPMLPPYGAHDGADAPPPYTDPDKPTPYLGLKARLSQVWINRWTILILLVLIRVLLAVASLQGNMSSAQTQALSACNSVQSMGSAMASMPHYMAQGVNELTADGVTSAVNGLVDILNLIVTGVEGLVVFYINFLTQVYLCLFTLVARGAAEAGLSVAEDVTNWLSKELPSIGHDLSDAVSTAEDGLNDLSSALNNIKSKCNSVFTKSLCSDLPNVPTLNFSSEIDELDNLTLPSSIDDGISKVNSTIPTFTQVKNLTTTAIEYPFEEIKKLIKENLGNYSFDSSAFPVPAKKSLSFCGENDGINEFFQKTAEVIVEARKVAIAVLIVIAVLACLPMAYMEIHRWHTAKERAKLVGTTHDSLDVVYLVSRPHTSSLGMKIASRFNNSRHQILVRWIVAYATSIPALVLLSLGLAGLFSCLCQYLILKAVEREVPELTAEVTQFADLVIDSLNNASEQWALDTNRVINSTNTALNKDLFGWVNISTTALNNTLNTFIDKSNEVINETFGGTILYGAVSGIFDCVVELKVESVQKGLTWVSDHAYISLPQLPNNTFSVGAAASVNSGDSFLSDPGSTTSNQITEVVNEVTSKLQDTIEMEAKLSGLLVLLWLLLVLFGSIRALTFCCKRQRARGNGGGQAGVVAGPTEYIDPPSMMAGAVVPPVATSSFFAPGTATHEHGDNERAAATVAAAHIPGEDMHKDPFLEPSYEFQDQKLGFAGERTYSSAVQADDPSHKSAYVEFGGDEKRH
ncbi:Plasma membrane fusion protein prm1 [Talaromyces atroroseus]|uniref:Plasma membrane fusion protein PRM1 n=1 Tax=Talaromyces atroroseus TaxID=1441469 RepID=A0A225AWN9_TALAT|nr:Plasma membrane fusion protein prm1 [Talaromyces atroroseus]OKL60029.1 Plasma membrane fusion protein prm1 [Talaromyces atroroseus]